MTKIRNKLFTEPPYVTYVTNSSGEGMGAGRRAMGRGR